MKETMTELIEIYSDCETEFPEQEKLLGGVYEISISSDSQDSDGDIGAFLEGVKHGQGDKFDNSAFFTIDTLNYGFVFEGSVEEIYNRFIEEIKLAFGEDLGVMYTHPSPAVREIVQLIEA